MSFVTQPCTFNEGRASSHRHQHSWRLCAGSFREESSVRRGAKKDPQWLELKDTGKSASEKAHHTRLCSIPSAEGGRRAPSCQSPAAPRQTRARCALRGRESRSENSRHLAGGRCDKSLAEHRTESNFKISNRQLTALQRASSSFVCLYNALRGRPREFGSSGVTGTYCSAGSCGANPKA